MKVFSVFGVSLSGKTSTIEQIIKELTRRGYSVGSVKDIHFEQFAMDIPGTNTDRHKKAGSKLVTARGLHETDILFPKRLPVDQILDFYDHDYVVLEGVTDFNVPKILCAHNEQEIDERLAPTVFAISGVIANNLTHYKGLPVFNSIKDAASLVDYIETKVPHVLPNIPKECCGKCGASCEEMLLDIMSGKRQRSECKIDEGTVKLFIGDQEIKMVSFVKEMLEGILRGFLSNLKGYNASREITIKIYPDEK